MSGVRDRGAGEKILVVQTSFLGDLVLTLPLLSEVKRRFPGTELAVLCRLQAKNLAEASPDVDEVLTDDKQGRGRGLRGTWLLARELRTRNFTMALSPHKSFRSALLLFLAGIPHRIGFRQSAGWFLYHRVVDRDLGCHEIERNLSILKAFGIDPGDCRKEVRVEVDTGTREDVERVFEELGIGQKRGKLIIGLNPGSVWSTKRWSSEAYAELIVLLMEKYDCEILLFGGHEDRATVSKIRKCSGNLGISLVGKISLKELPCALGWCDIVVTNDSGPMHIAVARGIPVVAVFCATTPSLGFYPHSSRAVVVEKALRCRPCASHGGRRCPLGTEDCIRMIRAEDVLMAVDKVLHHRDAMISPNGQLYMPEFVTV
jgi:heptosyltransferase-2